MLLEELFNGQINSLGLFGSHVPDGTVHQLQSRLDCPFADLLALFRVLKTFDMGISAEFQVDLIGIMNGLLGQLRADQGRQITAHLIAQREFSIRKCTGTGKTGGDVTVRFAVHALFGLVLGAVALFYRLALFDHDDFLLAAFFEHLQCGKDPRGTCADNDNICVHNDPTPLLL